MSNPAIFIWRDESERSVVMQQGEQKQTFTAEQWTFICRCVDTDLANRLDDSLRLVRILKDKLYAERKSSDEG